MKRLLPFLFCFALLAGACTEEEVATRSRLTINGGEKFLSLDDLARSGKITVMARGPWRVTTAGQDWFTLSPTEGPAGYSEVEITLEQNQGTARSAQLAFACGDEIVPFVVSQSGSEVGHEDPDYYFYATFGTMPSLYAGLHVLSHDKPSYFFYGRSRTFDPAQFPSYVRVTTGADRSANTTTKEELEQMARDMKRRILEINNADPGAVYGLYVDDLRCRIGYDWFVAQGIDSARVKVSMLSDGTATYNNFANYFGDPATAERNWNTYASEVERLDWNHGGRYPETRSLPEFESYTWPYYLATLPGYRLVMQDGSLLESSGPFMTEKLAEMHIQNVQPYELLSSLSADAQQRFYAMTEFDYDHFAQLFDRSPKPNLVIIGTSHRSEESERKQHDFVARIVEQYAGYDIFFKPHPADTSSAGYETDFPGLTLLPGQMPFEIFVWSLNDHIEVIGGYPSTVYLTVPVDKVRFIFAPNAASLVRPLNLLFKDATQVEWIQ